MQIDKFELLFRIKKTTFTQNLEMIVIQINDPAPILLAKMHRY